MYGKVANAATFLIENRGIAYDALDVAHCGVADMQRICHTLAKESGWWEGQADYAQLGTKIALIHSEVSEALEGLRKGNMDTHLPDRQAIEVELADAMIRIMDLAGALQLDLAGAIVEKLAYNQQRADHKKENRDAEGGKKF